MMSTSYQFGGLKRQLIDHLRITYCEITTYDYMHHPIRGWKRQLLNIISSDDGFQKHGPIYIYGQNVDVHEFVREIEHWLTISVRVFDNVMDVDRSRNLGDYNFVDIGAHMLTGPEIRYLDSMSEMGEITVVFSTVPQPNVHLEDRWAIEDDVLLVCQNTNIRIKRQRTG